MPGNHSYNEPTTTHQAYAAKYIMALYYYFKQIVTIVKLSLHSNKHKAMKTY